MKISIALMSLLVVCCVSVAQGQQTTTTSRMRSNEFEELSQLTQILHQQDVTAELELSTEQRTKLTRLRHNVQMAMHRYHTSTATNQDEELKELYQKRMKEDVDLLMKKLNTKILLPHQVELFETIRKRKSLEAQIGTGFVRTKGTMFDGLDLSDQQLEQLAAMKEQLHEAMREERKRHAEAMQEIKEDAIDELRDVMDQQQREILGIE